MNQSLVVELQNVSKRFGTTQAVDALDLSLMEGEFFALLGPSGCGKTTLLRIIAGFETPDTGRVLLDGEDITHQRANRRPINLMFQSYALFPHMNVRSNIRYGLEMEKLNRAKIDQRVDEILQKTQLEEFALRKPSQLSGGQQQRVALARALIKRPRVLLLDEPLGALDKKLRNQMRFELKRLQHEFGITFVVVTHDQDEALVMADRIALMQNGVIAQQGTPSELYENPSSRFVADFIGESNFFDGLTTENGIQVDELGIFNCSRDTKEAIKVGVNATLAVRPERIKLSEQPLTEHNSIRGEIIETAYHGSAVDVLIKAGARQKPVAVTLGVSEQHQNPLQTGQNIYCCWLPKDGRLLSD